VAYTITKSCINCSRCLPECPTGAIEFIDGKYSINSQICNDCAGYYSVPQCRAFCPTNHGCIPSNSLNQIVKFNPTLNTKIYWENWFKTYNAAVSKVQSQSQTQPKPYWQTWFNNYNALLSKVQSQSQTKPKSYWEKWLETYNSAVSKVQEKTQTKEYWEEWFNTYEQTLTQLKGSAGSYWERRFDCYANTCQPILEK